MRNNIPKAADRRITRQDVAREAGVSLTTVTHALNPPPGARVSSKTRQRVEEVARELGYRPSFVGRALQKGRTYTVGLLQPTHENIFSYFYQQIILGLVRAMEPDDYHPLILFCDDHAGYRKVIRQGRVDGMLILQSNMDMTHIDQVAETGIPGVVINKGVDVASRPGMGCVHSDHHRMMHEVVDEFAGLGCHTILGIHDYRFCDANSQMFQAFVEATSARTAEGISGTTIIPDNNDFAGQIENVLKAGQRWDGVFVDGQIHADIFLQEAEKAGYIPERDFHLITSSCNNGETSSSRKERSAYTHQPQVVGERAWEMFRAILGGSVAERKVMVPYKRYQVSEGPGCRISK